MKYPSLELFAVVIYSYTFLISPCWSAVSQPVWDGKYMYLKVGYLFDDFHFEFDTPGTGLASCMSNILIMQSPVINHLKKVKNRYLKLNIPQKM